jgi:hypothetical protein
LIRPPTTKSGFEAERAMLASNRIIRARLKRSKMMSYCRWSCDNWKSDVYVYESADGFVTHVAVNKIVGTVPAVPHILDLTEGRISLDDYRRASVKASRFLDRCKRAPLGLPSDGKTFIDATPDECAETLLRLRAEGYHVPQYAIDELHEEATEAA